MPLPLTVSCFSEIQIGFTFLVPADPDSAGRRAVKHVCVCLWFRSYSDVIIVDIVSLHYRGGAKIIVMQLLAGRPAANQQHAAAAVDRRDRLTDGRTPDRYIDFAVHTARAVATT